MKTIGNPFIYWGLSFAFLLLGALSHLWVSEFWGNVLAGLSGVFLVLFTVAALLEMRTWKHGIDWW